MGRKAQFFCRRLREDVERQEPVASVVVVVSAGTEVVVACVPCVVSEGSSVGSQADIPSAVMAPIERTAIVFLIFSI